MHASPRSRSQPEELITYVLLVAIGAIPVATALGEQAVFGVEATLGLIMMSLGTVGVVAYAFGRRTCDPR